MTKTYINPDSSTGIELSLENLTMATISPSQLTANQNDWAPTGYATAGIIRVSTDASRNLTGIVAPSARKLLIIENIGSFDLVLKHDVTSTAANRFLCPNDTDLTLQKDSAVVLQYDTTTSRWRVVGGTGTGGGGSAISVEDQAGTVIDSAVDKIVVPVGGASSLGSHDVLLRALPSGIIGVRATRTAAKTISNATWTSIDFTGSDTFDTDDFHAANATTCVVPTGLSGPYLAIAFCGWAANGSGNRYSAFTKNGSRVIQIPAPPLNQTGQGYVITDVLNLVATDAIGLDVYQDSTGNLDTSTVYLILIKLDSGRVGTGIGAQAVGNGTTSCGNGVFTSIAFGGTDNWDTDGFHDPSSNNTRMTIPVGLSGIYYAHGIVRQDSNQTGTRVLGFAVNGSTDELSTVSALSTASTQTHQVSQILKLNAGDYVEVKQYQDSGGTRTPSGLYFTLMRLDSLPADVPTWTQWTATVGQTSGVTISSQDCWYSKVGAITYFYGRITLGGSGTSQQNIIIGGQPAALQSVSTSAPIGMCQWANQGSWFYMFQLFANGPTDWRLMQWDWYEYASNGSNHPGDALANNDVLAFSGFIRNA